MEKRHDRRIGLWLLIAIIAAAVGLGFVDARAALAQDVGYRDFAYGANGVSTPTGDKPQSKLWFNDGTWWGSLFDNSPDPGEDPSGEYHIYRFDWGTQTWSDTGTPLDRRNTSRSDILWDGNYLYVATATPSSTASDTNAYVLRYSYDAATKNYTPDQGFPVVVGAGPIEAIVLDKDTTGKLWVTYTQGNQVYVNHSSSDDKTWGTPFVLPVEGTSVTPDDISAVIAFDSKIGVMWSNQNDDTMYFATHDDGDPDGAWQGGIAARGAGYADDHINLKSVQADSAGRVFAAVKTSLNDGQTPDPEAPLIWLLVLGADGNWKQPVVFGRVKDDYTRPIVTIDQANRKLYMFATAPCCSGGTIYYKQANLSDNISFPEGAGTPFIQSSTDTNINDATSAKQNLTSDTGLLVLASDDVSKYYWHNTIDLVDDTAPTVEAPSKAMVSPGPVGLDDQPQVPVKVSWSGSDSESGVAGYEVERSVNNGSYAPVSLPSPAATSVTLQHRVPGSYRYRVRARDGAGKVSDWVYGPAFTIQDAGGAGPRIAYTGSWITIKDPPKSWGDTFRTAKAAGATAKLTFTGSEVIWVSNKRVTRGIAEVWVDDVKEATVDLYSATSQYQQAVFRKEWPSSGKHKVEVRVLNTKNPSATNTYVAVDEFIFAY